MTLQSLAPMLNAAKNGGYAVAQFNVDTVEIAQAVLMTSEKMHAPVILAIGQGVDKTGRF
jgi:fructose-bisphosphate aldolase class II